MKDQAVRSTTQIDFGENDDAIAARVPTTKNVHNLAPVPHPPINEGLEDQAAMKGHLLKDFIKLGAEDNATDAGFNNFYMKTMSGDLNVPTIPGNIPVSRFKSTNLFSCRTVISKADPTNAPAGLQEQAIPGPIQLEFDKGKRAMTRHNHDLGNFDLNPGGADGQGDQVLEDQGVVETLPQKDLIELGVQDQVTVPTGDIPKVVSGPLPFEVDGGKHTITTDSHNLGNSHFNTRFKFDNLFTCGLGISEIYPTNVMAGLQ